MRAICHYICIFVVLALLCSCDKGPASAKDKGENKDEKADLVPVEVTPVVRKTLSHRIVSSATVSSAARVEVFPRKIGVVEAMQVKEGQRVGQGTVLAVIEDKDEKLLVKRAELNIEQADREYRRIEELAKKKIATPQQVDQALFQLDSAKVALEEAQKRLADTRIRAPISGTIIDRIIVRGETVNPGKAAFVMADLDRLEVEVKLPEQELSRLALKQQVDIQPLSLADKTFKAEVTKIAPSVDPKTGTVTVTLGLKKDKDVKLGMFVRVVLHTELHEDVLAAPKKVLVYQDENTYFYRVEKSTDGYVARREPARLGITEGDLVEIVNPLDAGDHLVILGQNGLSDGAAVEVLNLDEPASPVKQASNLDGEGLSGE